MCEKLFLYWPWLAQLLFCLTLLSMVSALHAEEMATGATADPRPYFSHYVRPMAASFPTDNQYTSEREQLGKALFFDPRLSGSNWISCSTCHNPACAWGDGLRNPVGHGLTTLGRRTPKILSTG